MVAQPGLQPVMEKPIQFNQFSANVSPPPQVHANTFNGNPAAFQMQMMGNQQQWGHATPSPIPKTSEFGSFNTTTSSGAFGASAYSGSPANGQTPYTSPQTSILRSASPPSNMLYGQPMQQDEGKMSVSIDFGMDLSLSTSLFPFLMPCI